MKIEKRLVLSTFVDINPDDTDKGIFHKEAIERDFDIFYFENTAEASRSKTEKVFHNVFHILHEYKFLSYSFANGSKHAFGMAKKGVIDHKKLEKSITDVYPEVIVTIINIMDERTEGKFWFGDRLLLKLLLNSLASAKDKKNAFSGALYYSHADFGSKDGKYIYFMRIDIIKGCVLQLSVESYQRVKIEKAAGKRLYKFNEEGYFVPVVGVEEGKEVYIKKSMESNHNTIPFLKLGSMEAFSKTKIGLTADFLEDCQYRLSDYLDFKLKMLEMTRLQVKAPLSAKKTVSIYAKKIADYGYRIKVIDLLDTEVSRSMAMFCNDYIRHIGLAYDSHTEKSADAFPLYIAYDDEHYKRQDIRKAGIRDPYKEKSRFSHFLTVGSELNESAYDKQSEDVLSVIIREICIKISIHEHTIELPCKDTIFRESDEITTYYREGKKDPDTHKRLDPVYHKMTIWSDGDFEYEKFTYEQEEYDYYREMFETERKHDRVMSDRETVGIIEINNQKLVLSRTEAITIPSPLGIKKAMSIDASQPVIGKQDFISFLMDFVRDSDSARADEIHKFLVEKINEEAIPAKKLRSIFSNSEYKAVLSEVIRDYPKSIKSGLKAKGIDCSLRIKGRGNEMLNMGGIQDILFTQVYLSYEKKSVLYYVSGYSNPQASIERAPRIYVLRRMSQKPEETITQIDEGLLQLLAVDNVRNGEFSTVPVTFKYLKEAIQLFS